jgi:hypothetical protein
MVAYLSLPPVDSANLLEYYQRAALMREVDRRKDRTNRHQPSGRRVSKGRLQEPSISGRNREEHPRLVEVRDTQSAVAHIPSTHPRSCQPTASVIVSRFDSILGLQLPHNAKIEQAHIASYIKPHVLRFQVTINDT